MIGGAALGAAKLANRRSRPKRTGISIPHDFNTPRFDASKLTKGLDASKLTKGLDARKLADHVDLKDIVRQIGNVAEQVEARSEDVRMLSAQAKKLSRKLS